MAQQLLSVEGVPFYALYASSVEQLHDIRRADTHEVVHIQHKTLAECLEFYFVHPEWKAANPDGIGPLTRRHVRVLRHVLCGKETSRVLDDEADETDGTLVSFEEQVFAVGSLREVLRQYRIRDLMAATGLPRQTLYDLMDGAEPAPPTVGRYGQSWRALPVRQRCPMRTVGVSVARSAALSLRAEATGATHT